MKEEKKTGGVQSSDYGSVKAGQLNQFQKLLYEWPMSGHRAIMLMQGGGINDITLYYRILRCRFMCTYDNQ